MKLLQKLQSIGYLRTLNIYTYTIYTKDNKNNVTRHKYKIRKSSDKLLVLGFLKKKKAGVWAGPEDINFGNYRVRFQIHEKKKYCIMVLALGTGTKGESILGPTPTAMGV